MADATTTGRQAEQVAAEYLINQGYQILARNWRTRFCEIDVVARQGDAIHIVEVKFRTSSRWGAAAEYVGYHKLARLQRAAMAWCQANRYAGAVQIDVIAVEGHIMRPRVTHLPNIGN